MEVKIVVRWVTITAVAAGISTLIAFWKDVGLPGLALTNDVSKMERRIDYLEVNQIKSDLIRAGNAATNLTILITKEEEKPLSQRNHEYVRIWKEQLARVKQEIKEKEARLELLRKKHGWSSGGSFLR